MSRDFSLSDVIWKKTLWHNTIRAISAAVVWWVLAYSSISFGIIEEINIVSFVADNPFLIIVLMPCLYFVLILPLGMAVHSVHPLVAMIPIPYGRLVNIIGLMIVVGDPIVYMLNNLNSKWIPAHKPKVFSMPSLFITEFKLEDIVPYTTSCPSCSRKGKILTDEGPYVKDNSVVALFECPNDHRFKENFDVNK